MIKTQVRPPNEGSFWNLSGVSWDTLICGKPDYSDDPWVRWQGRTWLRKLKDEAICEIVGYQIAGAFGLPLQPWAAFYHTASADKLAPQSGIGILVEQWKPFHSDGGLWAPAKTHPDLVGRAMALAVLDRSEWPRWLMSEDETELRLFDLEYIGPFLHWPPSITPVRDYSSNTSDCLASARERAFGASVHEVFASHLERLKMLDFSQILDLSGHPRSTVMERVIVRGLEARQQRLRRILG